MERDAPKSIYLALLRDRFVQAVSVVLLLVVVFSSVFFGLLSGLIVILFYCLGVGLPILIIRNGELRTPSWLSPVIYRLVQKEKSAPASESLKCNVCGDQNCNREKIVHKQKPWAGLNVPQEVDEAVETLLEKCLEEYVQSWYSKVSMDSSFPTELRQNVRYAACVILNRLLKVDLGVFLAHKIIPVVTQHVNVCLQNEKGDKTKRILYHPAVFSRKVELDYLRYRVDEILPIILEQKNLKCNLFSGIVTEVLAGWILLPLASTADTTVLNNLLLILLGSSQLTSYPPSESEKVEFLSNFANNHVGLESNHRALHPDMCNILKDQSLLYAFMQFLKDQGAVHVLNFCLDVDNFNKRMLNPELSTSDLEILHRDAWDLFSVYFSPHSPDNIGFPSELVVQMRKANDWRSNLGWTVVQSLLNRSSLTVTVVKPLLERLNVLSKDVTKLRTSPPLFMAYEHAYGLLDKNYCPLFHTSDEFYQWLCGPRTPASLNLSGARRIYRRNESTASKLSTRLHKIKGALRAPTVDGHPFDTDVLPLDTDTEFGEELEEEEERDLTSYRVKINSADTKLDLITGKLTPTYIITVQKLGDGGRLEEEWCVERRLADFYSLEGKLTEFHGDFPDTQLPPCGLLAPSPPTNADVYEIYLQKLIANPSLRGSDLLYRFLTPSSLDFGAEDNAFGRLLRKSVPLSLRKERGQNTDHFIATFFQSTDTKKSKSEWKEGSCDVKPRKIRCLTNTVFLDNLGISLYNFPQSPPANGPTLLRVAGPSDALLIFGAKVFKVPNFLLRLALAVHSLLNKGLDSMCCFYIEKKLRSLLAPQRIAHLISLLQWIIFEKPTKSEPKEVALKVEERINELSGVKYTFYHTFYKLVQNRILNKQLLYAILDLVLDELFPETANISK